MFSKRDAHTYFDVIRAPMELQSWFGQPPVAVEELLEDEAFANALAADSGRLPDFVGCHPPR